MSASHSLLPEMLKKVDAQIEADKYREVADTYAAFVKEHPTTAFLASEPVPFKINVHLSNKYGSSATSTFTLRNTTWADDVKKALKSGPDAFTALVAKYDAATAEIAKNTKKIA